MIAQVKLRSRLTHATHKMPCPVVLLPSVKVDHATVIGIGLTLITPVSGGDCRPATCFGYCQSMNGGLATGDVTNFWMTWWEWLHCNRNIFPMFLEYFVPWKRTTNIRSFLHIVGDGIGYE